MAYQSQVPVNEHEVIKTQKAVNAVIGVLKQELVVPNLFQRRDISVFKGSLGDTVTQRFPGNLPWREYNFRNDRTDPIVFDTLTEATATITVGDRIYSATHLTDEQRDFDDLSIEQLTPVMAQAVVDGIAAKTKQALAAQTYPVTIGNAQGNLRGALVEARKVLNALKVPVPNRTLLVGSDFESAMLLDEKLTLAQNVGDARANSALSDATLGRVYGFNVVLDPSLAPGDAIALQGDSFALYSGAASIPRSALGAVKSYGGYSLRLIRSYEQTRFIDLASVDTYLGIAPIKDRLVSYDETTKLWELTDDQYFVRAIKLQLDGSSNYPEPTDPVSLYSGLSSAKVWTPTGYKAETDPANA